MKKFVTLLLSLSMVLALTSACGSTITTSSTAATTASATTAVATTPGTTAVASSNEEVKLDGEIKFGLSCALTGNFPLAGQRTREGVDLALEEINAAGGVLGKKLVYTIEDDQNTQQTAVNVVTKIVNAGVCAVIGPHTSGNIAAVSDIYLTAKIPFLTGGTSPKLALLDNPYFFRIRPSDVINGQVAAKYAVDTLKATKVGISFNNNDFGTGARDVIIQYLDNAKIPYVAVGHNAGDKDLTGQIMQLKSEGVDCIISWTDDAESALTARQLYELGMKVPVISSAGITMDQVLNLVEPEYVEGWYAVTDFASANTTPKIVKFVEDFTAKYGYKPELYASSYYSATYVLADAIKRAGSTDPEAIRAALATTKDLDLTEGYYTCNDKGEMVAGCLLVQIKNKVPTVIEYVDMNK